MQVCKYARVCKYASVQVCKYEKTHMYASMEICKYAHICKYVSVQVCSYMQRFSENSLPYSTLLYPTYPTKKSEAIYMSAVAAFLSQIWHGCFHELLTESTTIAAFSATVLAVHSPSLELILSTLLKNNCKQISSQN